MTNLYKKHLYLNKEIDRLINFNIREYDIKSAGFNILISANYLSKKEIDYLSSLPKKERNITIGCMCKKNKEMKKIINDGLVKYRELFFKENNIEDYNILSIKKDAIFLINKIPDKTKFDNVEFVCKNKYSSYYYLNSIQFYFDGDDICVKGLGKKTKKHKKYLLKELSKLFKKIEMTNSFNVPKLIKEFSDRYKQHEMHIKCYREMNLTSTFKTKNYLLLNNKFRIGITNVDSLNDIDISYNYNNYIIPLIHIFF